MDRKRLLQIGLFGLVFCGAVTTMVLLSHSSKNTSSRETNSIQETTTIQQVTTQAETKIEKKAKKVKKKQSLFPKKYKKIKVVKISEEDETTSSNNDYSDEIAEVYQGKSLASEEAGVALEGCIVKVKSSDKNWTKIKSDKVEGYIESKYIVKGKKARQVLLNTEHVLAKIKKENVNIKNDKTKKGSNIGIAYAKTTYPILEISKDEKWVKIKRTESLSGWIPASTMKLKIEKEYVYTSEEYDEMVEAEWKANAGTYKLEKSKLPKSGEARELIEYASKFLGNRYVWGGTSLTKGADCSGFVQSIFKHFGYKLNRTAAEQSRNGKSVSNNELKPGDLLFYHTDRRQKNRISHVAIYIGNGKIIHAANRRVGIIISNMGNPCAARRILTGKNDNKEDEKDKQKNKNSEKNKKHKIKDNKKIPETIKETTKNIETTKITETEKQQETTTEVQQETTESETIKEE